MRRMCGRFVSSNSPADVAEWFAADLDAQLAERIDGHEPSFNVAPTEDVLAVTADRTGHRWLRSYRWGLVPSWAKDVKIGAKMINARSETLLEKPAFRRLLESKRIIVPMDGFYEWEAIEGQRAKRPWFVHHPDRTPLGVAGLWAAWRDPARADEDGAWLHSCTIITTEANSTMARIHDRMPVVLPVERWGEWLDPGADVGGLRAMLVPARDGVLTMHEVGTDVNNVRNDGPELIAGVA